MPTTSPLPTPTIENTAAVIVSYYADASFADRLHNLNTQFPAVFWVDNTPEKDVGQVQQCGPRVQRLSRGYNAGLASALNSGCEAALNANFKWVVSFDQDSDIVADFLLQQVDAWGDADPRTFILGCNYADGGNLQSPRFRAGETIRPCPTVITSGCLLCLKSWDELGRFRDDYFIDGVDHEICLRGRANDLIVARHGRVLMNHSIGERSLNYRVFPYVHSALRKYYSMRNGVRNIIQYWSTEPTWAARKCATLAWEFVAALLFEAEKRRKARAMTRGFRDGVKGNMGIAPDEFVR